MKSSREASDIPVHPAGWTLGFLLLAAGLVAGCADGAPASQGSEEEPRGESVPEVWTGTTPAGVGITVRPPSLPVPAGPARFRVELDGPPPDPDGVTVDLLAPEMPAHGIVRFDVVPDGESSFIADVDVPMEGRWLLYVNLDVGAEAVPFEFQAGPGKGHEHEHHHP